MADLSADFIPHKFLVVNATSHKTLFACFLLFNTNKLQMLRIKTTVFQYLAKTFVDKSGGGDIIYEKVDGENGPIRVLKYMPSNSKQEKYPVHVHIHGGGWVIGVADMDNAWCRRTADETGSVVISIDYAKAPQYPFPAALHDVRDVILSLSEDPTLDVSRLTIGGLSAGGNLSIAWTVYCLQNNLVLPVLLIPIYPATDLTIPYSEKMKRVPEETRAKSLSFWMADMFSKSYTTSEEEKANPLASPVRAPANLLAKFPKTIILTAELDCLHVEADDFAKQLSDNGVDVIHHLYPGAIHGYANYRYDTSKADTPDAKAKEESFTLMVQEIKKATGSS